MRQPRLTFASLAIFLSMTSCGSPDDSETQPFNHATGGVPGGGTGAIASGATGAGGSSGAGGTATGGASTTNCTNVRPTGTDWDDATCADWARQTTECSEAWMIDNHYCDESCGRCTASSSGGSTGSGGSTSGSGGTVIDSSCTEGNRQVCNNESGTHCGYTYEYWKDQGSGCMVNTSDGFSVEWSNINNLLGRKGRRPGSSNQVVTYDADYNPDGNSYLCIYGWTRNPLVEYYIVDSWGDWRPPGNDGHVGTTTSDGGTYDIYRIQKTGPSIDGNNTTFTQYWSVRTARRESGTITVGNHFDAWAGLGMNMGSLYEVSMCVEGYQSSGSATVRMSME